MLTKLYMAISNENEEIVTLLIEKGINPNALSSFDDEEYDDNHGNSYYYNVTRKRSPLHLAISLNNINLINHLINYDKTDVNILDEYNNTPLHHIINNSNNEEIIKMLNLFIENPKIKDKININIKNKYNETPLDIAIRKNNTEAVKLLLKLPNIDLEETTDNDDFPI